MSFDIFVIAADRDGSGRFERRIVEQAFGRFTPHIADDYWCLHHPNGEEIFATVSIDEGDLIESFSVNRPPSFEWFPEFWQALFEVLQATRTFLVWPALGANPTYCVANPELLANMPAELTDGMGPPATARCAQDIDLAIAATDC
jgi:hypothetical protein